MIVGIIICVFALIAIAGCLIAGGNGRDDDDEGCPPFGGVSA